MQRSKEMREGARKAMHHLLRLHELFKLYARVPVTFTPMALLDKHRDADPVVDSGHLEEIMLAAGCAPERVAACLGGVLDDLADCNGEVDFGATITCFSILYIRDEMDLMMFSRGEPLEFVKSDAFPWQRPAMRERQWTKGCKALVIIGCRIEGARTGAADEDEDDVVGDTEANCALLHARVQAGVTHFLTRFDPRYDMLILSGGRIYNADNDVGHADEWLPAEAQLMLSFALAAGVERRNVHIDAVSINTIEAAMSVKKMLQEIQSGASAKCTVCTSDITMLRTRTIFEALLPAFPLTFEASPTPSTLGMDHIERISSREAALMGSLRDHLEAYLSHVEAGGCWPPIS